MKISKKPKICLACSAGGHLTEMVQLEPFYSKYNHFFISFEREDSRSLAKDETVFFIERPARNPVAAALSFFQALKIILMEKPGIVLSTGADAGLIACLAAKFAGKKIVFIESFCRPVKPGISGRIAYLFADLFIYQWKDLSKYYPKGIYGGSIF